MTGDDPHFISNVQAVIDSAKARDSGKLQRFIAARVPEADEAEVAEASESALAVIETVPILLLEALRVARERGVARMVDPLLERAARYFVDPVDLIPEMTHGVPGLLDDAYLSIKILQHLNSGPQTFLEWDFDQPLGYLRALVGPEIAGRLDDLSVQALRDVSESVTQVWREMAREA